MSIDTLSIDTLADDPVLVELAKVDRLEQSLIDYFQSSRNYERLKSALSRLITLLAPIDGGSFEANEEKDRLGHLLQMVDAGSKNGLNKDNIPSDIFKLNLLSLTRVPAIFNALVIYFDDSHIKDKCGCKCVSTNDRPQRTRLP